jgi:cyclophilin family peptidyl-prolyl cis-trans isomerase
MLRTIKEVVDAEIDGKMRNYVWRKTPSQASSAGVWFDLSMSPGMPPPQYYIGAITTATLLKQSTDGGLYHGQNVSPSTKYLRSITTQASVSTALPMNVLFCDYLMFYPFIDEGTTDEQLLTNVNTLSRYVDGKGVQVMAITTNAGTGGQQFFFTYTNSDGVSGRISQTVTMNTSTAIGTVIGSNTNIINASNPFIGLQLGDSGVRSIESVTMLGIDTGLFSLVLVKPLIQTCFREIIVPYEKDFLVPTTDLVKIQDDAFLGMLCLPMGSLAATVLRGDLKVIWE